MCTNLSSIIPKLTLITLTDILAKKPTSILFLTSNYDSNIILNIIIIRNRDSIVTDTFLGLDLFFLASLVQPGQKNYREVPNNIMNSDINHQSICSNCLAIQYD